MKRIFKIACFIMSVGIVMNIITTVWFLLLDGWHLSAVREAEKNWDVVCGGIFAIGFLLFQYCVYKLLRVFVDFIN